MDRPRACPLQQGGRRDRGKPGAPATPGPPALAHAADGRHAPAHRRGDVVAHVKAVVRPGRRRPPAVATAAACTECAARAIPGAPEYEPGHHMALVCLAHAGELEEQGWTVEHDLYGDEGTTDVICPHIKPVSEQTPG